MRAIAWEIMSSELENNYIKIFSQWLQNLETLPETPCSYFNDRKSKVLAFLSREGLQHNLLDYLFEQGFRRSGDIFYQNHCQGCKLCLPYRVSVSHFQINNRSFKRVLKKNQDIRIRIATPLLSKEKKKLYIEYQKKQHFLRNPKEKEKEINFSAREYLRTLHDQMYKNVQNSLELEIWKNNKLVSFTVFDIASNSLSAVYLVYDIISFPKASLGTLSILKLLEYAQMEGFNYVYLGFWIPGHSKMDYKKRYLPAQILNPIHKKWENAENFIKNYKEEEFFQKEFAIKN